MSTYEALRFLGLDYYATATDIKAAYRRLAADLRRDPGTGDTEFVRAAEQRMQMLHRAYAALQHRVDHTPPEMDVPADGEPVEKPVGLRLAASLRWMESWKVDAERLRQRISGVRFPRVGRVAAVFVVMAGVGYGIVRGAAAKHFAPTVVDAKMVSVPQVQPMLPAPAVRVTAAEKTLPVREKKAPVVAAARPLRAPVLPGVDPVEAKAIGSACLAATGEKADAYQACVVRTARETPHPIHLD